jgi:CHAT domain-containing protein
MAALYDGSHYLTESYANVVINLASLINLKDKPSSEWTALGLGVSKAHQNWPELRYVPVELKGIIRDEDSTSKLLLDFYKCHASVTATTKAEALRQAQLDLLLQTNGEYSHPFYWAPFVVIGHWQ